MSIYFKEKNMEQEINKILGVSESFFAPQRILEFIFDKEKGSIFSMN